MVKKDGKHKLVGFVDLGEMHDAFEKISGNVNVHLFHSSFFGYNTLIFFTHFLVKVHI